MQKHGFPLPKYTTISYGESHIPSFSSTVEIKGEFFKGDVAKTKKQAEMNAAKVAWSHLKEGKLVGILQLGYYFVIFRQKPKYFLKVCWM